RRAFVASLLASWLLLSGITAGELRLQDICHVKGQEENTLHGLGLVVGLNGTGDGDTPTVRALAKMMELMGTPVSEDTKGRPLLDELKGVKNVAMVFVTVTVPRNGAREGDQLDCHVSAISAKSLEGGFLMLTPLLGPRPGDHRIYGNAKGPVALDQTGHPTVGQVHSGARMEEEFRNTFEKDGIITLVLDRNHASFQTAYDIEETLNNPQLIGALNGNENGGPQDPAGGSNHATAAPIAKAIDQMNIEVRVPPAYQDNVVQFVAEVMVTRIFPPQNDARVVINERNGVIVIGDNVEIGPVAISHKNLSIKTGNDPIDDTMRIVDPASDTSTTKLRALVDALNALKVNTQDIIDIIKELQRSGRLYGHVIIE
ncbi:MAG: flagellar basal body P-ring protein FlgI, partial [Pirellulaceae bacterium]